MYSGLQNRAFTQIAYMDLDKKYKDKCAQLGTDKVKLWDLMSDEQRQHILDIGISKDELQSWYLKGVYDDNDNSGFYGCIIETSPSEAVCAFRGSEDMTELSNTVHDWGESDIGLVNNICTRQQYHVDKFLEKYADDLKKYDSVGMTGHSLGGNLAEYGTIVSYKYGLDKVIKQCESIDGPGFSQEFIAMYYPHIIAMSVVMFHPRYSFVGTMENDLPGVTYMFVQVDNKASEKAIKDGEEYNCATRHDTKYIVYDDEGNYVEGEQDTLSKWTSRLSKGLDALPIPISSGTAIILSIGLVVAMWAKNEFTDNDGNLKTEKILAYIIGAMVVVGPAGLVKIAVGVLAVVVTVAIVFVAAVVVGIIMEVAQKLIAAACEIVQKIYNWTKEKVQQLKEAIVNFINGINEWANQTFNYGYRYASQHPYVKLETVKLRAFADRLNQVNGRIVSLDRRMDSLYTKVGLLDLWNLIQADVLTGYSFRLLRCADYLNNTAWDYEVLERELSGRI